MHKGFKKQWKNLKPFSQRYPEPMLSSDSAQEKEQINPLEFTIGMIYCGFDETNSRQFVEFNHIKPPSVHQIENAIRTIEPVLEQMARDSAWECSQMMPDGAIISVDGSWDHRRHGPMCVVDVICVQTKKIIDFDYGIHGSERIDGNTEVSPNALEGYCFEKLVDRLKSNQKIIKIIKDGDVSIDSIIQRVNWNVTISRDPNHELKHFEKKFSSIVNTHKKEFYGLGVRIHESLVNILYSQPNKILRSQMLAELHNTILNQPYLKNGRSNDLHVWKYANNPECQQLLRDVITYCQDISNRFTRGNTTNYNEAFHSLKAKFLNKNFNNGNTRKSRLFASILEYNNRIQWIEDLYQRLNLPQRKLD